MNKLYKVALATGMIFSISSTLNAASNGEELFKNKCMTCHTISRPADMSTMIAPPAKGLIFHMTQDIGSDEKILAHINSFTMNPTKEKAICPSVKRFGLMPSQKDNITKEELNTVGKWMIENLKMTDEQYERRKQRGNNNRNN